MTPDQMRVGIHYIVTKPSKHREFQVGDKIRLMPDGDILNQQAEGWMPACWVPESTIGMEVEVDRAWIECRRAKLESQLAELDA